MPTVTDPQSPPVTPENPTTPEEPTVEPSMSILTPYMPYLTGNTSYWSLVVLGLLGLLSILFVFFAERNDEEVTLWKVFVKFIISVLVAAGIMWIVSLFASAKVALVVGIIAGFFFYISLWSVLGWIKSFLITVLSLIALAFFLAAIALASRFFFDDISQVLDFVTSIAAQRLMVVGIIGTFIGAILIATQLGSSFIRSFGQSLGATLIALVVVAFLAWINPLGTVSTVVLFVILFAILLWIMRFRIVSNLFVETIRIVRVALVLAVVIGIIIWIVL